MAGASIAVGSWVALGQEVGQLTKVDGGKIAISIGGPTSGGPTKWRTLADVKSVFGSSGVPKATLAPGDWVTLPDKKGGPPAVGQCVKFEGGRVNVKLTDGKVLWRGFGDITAPFDDAPSLPLLGAAATAAATPPKAPPGKPSNAVTSAAPAASAAPLPAKPAPTVPLRPSVAASEPRGLLVQTSGVGGGEDIEVEREAVAKAGTIGGLKALLRARHTPWADLELRVLVDRVQVADDQPVSSDDGGVLRVGAHVMAMALRHKPAALSANGAPSASDGAPAAAATSDGAPAAAATSDGAPAAAATSDGAPAAATAVANGSNPTLGRPKAPGRPRSASPEAAALGVSEAPAAAGTGNAAAGAPIGAPAPLSARSSESMAARIAFQRQQRSQQRSEQLASLSRQNSARGAGDAPAGSSGALRLPPSVAE